MVVKHKFSLLQALLAAIALLAAACVSTPSTPPPEWARDIEAVYPKDKYIAQTGMGATVREAENNALAAIARFITSEILATTHLRMQMTDTGKKTQERREIDDVVFVKSQMNLSLVRYAREAYYYRRQYETVAYIDRDEAWEVYAPRFTRLAKAFVKLYDSAANETDNLKAAVLYSKAKAYSQNEEFSDAETFGQILNPQKMNKTFSDVRRKLQALPDDLSQAFQNTVVYVDVSSDDDSRVENAVTKCLNKAGFATSKNKNSAAVCRVKINEGYKQVESGNFYFPSAVITLSGRKAGEVFSCAVSADKQGAVSKDVARRRAYTALAAAITENFNNEFEKTLGGKSE